MKKGFTLIEMLVVVGIIAILIGASFGSYNAFVKKAARARCSELVSNVHTALEAVMQKEGAWPRPVLAAGSSGNGEMTKEVGAALARRGALSLSYRMVERDGASVCELTGNDRCGVVTPWALDVLKRNPSAGDSTPVPSGGSVSDHRLRFAVDDDYDGFTTVSGAVGGGSGGHKVRASACVWCCGADGKFGNADDVRSWTKAQEVK